MHLEYMKDSLFEISYKKLLNDIIIYIYIYIKHLVPFLDSDWSAAVFYSWYIHHGYERFPQLFCVSMSNTLSNHA